MLLTPHLPEPRRLGKDYLLIPAGRTAVQSHIILGSTGGGVDCESANSNQQLQRWCGAGLNGVATEVGTADGRCADRLSVNVFAPE